METHFIALITFSFCVIFTGDNDIQCCDQQFDQCGNITESVSVIVTSHDGMISQPLFN